jgi:TusE/DsrC/DsvC family sulfur relay protein
MEKIIEGQVIHLNEEGYLLNIDEWSKNVAIEIANEESIIMTDKHFEIVDFIRLKVKACETLTIRSIGKSGITDIKGFYNLFPGAPLKKASRIAGVPKPSSCV